MSPDFYEASPFGQMVAMLWMLANLFIDLLVRGWMLL